MNKSGTVAIVGAGLSGLSCAQALRAGGLEVRLFERGQRVGGRCATTLWQGHLVDHGIQYFTAQTPEFKRELLIRLRQFRPIVAPILDHERKVISSTAGPRFYVLQGNNYLAQVLSHGLDVRLNTSVDSVAFNNHGIECLGETYRAVVSSLPSPQTARLFSLDETPEKYICGISALLEYSGSDVGDSRDCYGRIMPPGSEPLLASYCENHKSGRIIGNKTVFVAQAAPCYSAIHAEAPQEEYLPAIIRAHEELWKIPAGKCTASIGYLWRLSRPEDTPPHRFKLPPGAFVCGDSRSTESTVEDVWLDGRRVADEVLTYLAA